VKSAIIKIKIDWALADYRVEDWLGIRIGQLKAPHGLYNEYRDIDSLRTFIFLPQSVYPEITRDVTLSIQGAGLYGLINMREGGRLSYQAFYGTQTIDPNSRLSENLAGFPQDTIDNESSKVDEKYAGNLIWDTPLTGLRLGASYSNITMALNGYWNKDIYFDLNGTQLLLFEEGSSVMLENDPVENWVYSMEITWRNLLLMAEYMDRKRNIYSSVSGGSTIDAETTGWYAGAAYRFTDWFELGGYYSTIETTDLTEGAGYAVPDWYIEQEDICVTARFDINEYWTLKLEYHDLTGALGLSARDNPSDTATFVSPTFFEEDWTMFAAKITVSF